MILTGAMTSTQDPKLLKKAILSSLSLAATVTLYNKVWKEVNILQDDR